MHATDEVELGAQVRSAVWRLYRRFRNERPEGSLGDTALEVLTRLHKHGPQTLTELSQYDQVAPASMSQSVNRLTSAGYAVRTPDPNDRQGVVPHHCRRRRARRRRPKPTPRLAGRPTTRTQPRGSGRHCPRLCAAQRHRRHVTPGNCSPRDRRRKRRGPVRPTAPKLRPGRENPN